MRQLDELEREQNLLEEFIKTQKLLWLLEAKLKLIRQHYIGHHQSIITTLENENAQRT
ncbi:MAG: hypothetical protein N0C88_11740 [Candidatus Thiodiazotropha lotti]|uniref:Uncharacterized protein n=1 Tax=Candidatus Thiodiazotropha lotti TaxID=2792787 RepID=A0A9E4K4J8_9GAMM|nr:hypothetical protein [Candidatus Thiodiazotropha lotti]MCW4203974.1 hypothetical protein [Candidatus Thiodiazotropha lotti]